MNKKSPFVALTVAASSAFPVCAQTIDVKKDAEPFTHHWSVGAGADRTNEGLRARWLEYLEMMRRYCGFQCVCMHDLFDDDIFVYSKKPNEKVVYNRQYIDEAYDRMLALGVKPFVELSFFPEDIAATDSKQQMWYRNNVSVGRNNFDKWHDLVREFTQHVVDRCGIDEISIRYFEVQNRPNLSTNLKVGFFDGTKSGCFRIYKESANAIKSIDKRSKIGGLTTSNFIIDDRHKGEIMDHKKSVSYSQDIINVKQWEGVWTKDFLRLCEKENLPVDFISTRPYPTDHTLDLDIGRSKDAIHYVHSLHDDIMWLRQRTANSKYPGVGIHLTEWNTSPNSRDRTYDILPPAAYILKANLNCLGMANSLVYWTFTDVLGEKDGGEKIFHGGFGMINYQGVVKSSFHAYRMPHQLRDEKLYYNDPLFVSRFSQTDKIAAIALNCPSEYEETVPLAANSSNHMQVLLKKVGLALKGLEPGTVFEIEILDKEHGNIYDDYLRIGAPHSPGYKEIGYLKRAVWSIDKQIVKVDSEGTLIWQSVLAPWNCVLIREL